MLYYLRYMNRTILIDADGVVIMPRESFFSQKLSTDYGIPLDAIMPFFKGEYKKVYLGQADITTVLPAYLDTWGWKGTLQEFLTYWYETEKDLNTDVVAVIRELRRGGAKVYLASDSPPTRATYLMDTLGLKNEVDGGFFSGEMGVSKTDPIFFRKISEKLGVALDELEFWDDEDENVRAAQGMGIQAHLFEGIGSFKATLGVHSAKRVFIVHRWDASPTADWYPWVADGLKARGFEVIVPVMPHPGAPEIGSWVSTLERQVGVPDADTYFVGHSVGCQTIVRYLAGLPDGLQVGGCVFVAGWTALTAEALPDEESADIAEPWLSQPIDWAAAKSHPSHVTAVFSDNDPFVPHSQVGVFEKNLGARIIMEPGKGHLSGEEGISSLPVVVEEISGWSS